MAKPVNRTSVQGRTLHIDRNRTDKLIDSSPEVQVHAKAVLAFLETPEDDKESPWIWASMRGFVTHLEYLPRDERWETIASGAVFTACDTAAELAHNVVVLARAHARGKAKTAETNGEAEAAGAVLSTTIYPALFMLKIFKGDKQRVFKFEIPRDAPVEADAQDAPSFAEEAIAILRTNNDELARVNQEMNEETFRTLANMHEEVSKEAADLRLENAELRRRLESDPAKK